MTINFGTFLLMQSPSARSSQGDLRARRRDRAGRRRRSASATSGSPSTTSRRTAISRARRSSRRTSPRRPRGSRVGTAVIVVPLHHPARHRRGDRDARPAGRRARRHRARAAATSPTSSSGFGLELESGRARWEESIDILLKAFEGQPFTYDGKLFKIPETSVFPQPLQQPHPPIWITAQSPESVEAAVRRGFNVLTGGFGVPIERMAEFRRLFDRLVGRVQAAPSAPRSACSARSTWPRARPTRGPPPKKRAGTCA